MHTLKDYKRAIKAGSNGGKHIKVALLGDTATQLLATAIRGEAILRGYNLELWEADYSQVEMQVMNPQSELHEMQPDYTILFQSSHKFATTHAAMDSAQQELMAEERLAFIRQACETMHGRVICYNYPDIDDGVFGSYASKVTASLPYQLCRLNMGLAELSQQMPQLFVCNMAGLQAKMGRDMMFQPSVYTNTEMVLSMDALPWVAARTVDIMAAAEGQFRKCLIMDLDNTLWGGVVGDDGWEGIQIGHGLGIGKAFSELQMWIKKLKQRGIILAVCSKNDEDKAREAFEKNPEMVLTMDDIAVFVANWDNKADNIRQIQQILNIGFDSMVFVDDNPFERNMVRENIEGICVPEMPEDPSDWLEYLYGLNLFETASYSEGDKDRTRQYQVEARRAALQKTFTDEAGFLKSLAMVSEVSGFNSFNTPRVAQLSQRSNQFNLRTVRYTEDEVAAMANDESCATFAFTLKDRFGDNGLISVVIMKRVDEQTLFIDTWFMSCRVLKRGMEDFVLNTIAGWAKEHGYKNIIGEYLPTAKNRMVEEHYPNLGFEERGNGRYALDVQSYRSRECHIERA